MKTKWHSGPPPSIGWWPASVAEDRGVIRWWNGRWWSVAAWPDQSAQEAAKQAKLQAIGQGYIKWSKPWWN